MGNVKTPLMCFAGRILYSQVVTESALCFVGFASFTWAQLQTNTTNWCRSQSVSFQIWLRSPFIAVEAVDSFSEMRQTRFRASSDSISCHLSGLFFGTVFTCFPYTLNSHRNLKFRVSMDAQNAKSDSKAGPQVPHTASFLVKISIN